MTLGASAAVLTPEQALNRAQKGMFKAPAALMVENVSPVFTVKTQSDEAAVYVFASNDSDGYVLLSADDVATPILGYSDEGKFDPSDMPPQMKWWLGEYSKEIEYARQNRLPSSGSYEAPADWTVIEPMIKTKWDQNAPYNDECPEYKGKKCYTGCVATAMAQVMNYHQYPEIGEGRANYSVSGLGRLTMSFSSQKFDWENMLDTYDAGYYTEAQGAAVAYLMKSCGYGVEMSYGTSASGAQSVKIASALTKFFKYDENIRYVFRMVYSSTEWNTMIYENLKNVGPVIYDGNSPEGGHSFVCDGYDGRGYFHFNWGWSGAGDGYFMLNALNPLTQGIGGYGGGYNSSQDAVLGIQMPTGEPVIANSNCLLQYGALRGEASGMNISMTMVDWNPTGYGNFGTERFKCTIGCIIDPVDGTVGETVYQPVSNSAEFPISVAAYYLVTDTNPLVVQVPSTLPDGKYKMTLASKESSSEEWIPTMPPYGYPNYFYVEKTGSNITVTNVDVPQIVVEDLALESECYYSYLSKLKIKLNNPTEFELTQPICPVLIKDGEQVFIGDSKLFTLAPGETVEEDWYVGFTLQNGMTAPVAGESVAYVLGAYNPDIKFMYGEYGNVEMQRLRTRNNIRSRNLTILNGTEEGDENEGIYYTVSDAENIEIEQMVEVITGYFAYPLMVRIYVEDEANPGYLKFEMEQSFNDIMFIKSGETGTTKAVVEFPEAREGQLYYMRTFYVAGYSANQLGTVRFKYITTGVDQVKQDNGIRLIVDRYADELFVESNEGIHDVQLCRADGTLIKSNVSISGNGAEVMLPQGVKGIVIVRISDNTGHIRSYKVAL